MAVARAEILISEGTRREFESLMRARGLRDTGWRSIRFGPGTESDEKLCVIEWDSIEAHVSFANEAAYAAFRDLISPFGILGVMEHLPMTEGHADEQAEAVRAGR